MDPQEILKIWDPPILPYTSGHKARFMTHIIVTSKMTVLEESVEAELSSNKEAGRLYAELLSLVDDI